jgi:hypothetical protein
MQAENHQMRRLIEIESGTNTILVEADDKAENHQMRRLIEIESGTNTILVEADDIQYLAQAAGPIDKNLDI